MCAALCAVVIWTVAPCAGAARDPDSGIYAIWFGRWPELLNLPFVKGGQVFVQWADLERAPGKYDFSPLDAQLKRYHDMGRKATVQVNGNRKPAYLYEIIAVYPERLSVQVADKQGVLQYWDPLYIDAYRRFVLAYGEHLRNCPYRDACLGVRLNFNAIGTEHGWLAREQRALEKWRPAPNGHRYDVEWTPEIFHQYQRAVVETFVEAFLPEVRVFVRNNVIRSDILGGRTLRLLKEGKLSLFHTSSEVQPRSKGVQAQYEAFLKYCRTGLTTAYAESWADAEGRHGGLVDARPFSPCQWNYWRLLVDLHCGVSFIAVYGSDLKRAGEPEFRAAFEFAARYAGYHASPESAPGAWVALREGDWLKGDYTFLMSRAEGSAPGEPLTSVGPKDQRFGAWARAVGEGEEVRFVLDPRFAQSVEGKPCRLRVVYLDVGAGKITIRWDGQPGQSKSFARHNSGRWREAIVDIPRAHFARGLAGADIALSGTGTSAFHMIEVQRIEG